MAMIRRLRFFFASLCPKSERLLRRPFPPVVLPAAASRTARLPAVSRAALLRTSGPLLRLDVSRGSSCFGCFGMAWIRESPITSSSRSAASWRFLWRLSQRSRSDAYPPSCPDEAPAAVSRMRGLRLLLRSVLRSNSSSKS